MYWNPSHRLINTAFGSKSLNMSVTQFEKTFWILETLRFQLCLHLLPLPKSIFFSPSLPAWHLHTARCLAVRVFISFFFHSSRSKCIHFLCQTSLWFLSHFVVHRIRLIFLGRFTFCCRGRHVRFEKFLSHLIPVYHCFLKSPFCPIFLFRSFAAVHFHDVLHCLF